MGKPWTRESFAEFKEIYGSLPDDWLAGHFGQTVEEIEALATNYALSKNKAAFGKTFKMPRWPAWQVEALRSFYPERSNLELARMLGRSIKSIVSKAHKLGLRKSRDRLGRMGRENVRKRWDDTVFD